MSKSGPGYPSSDEEDISAVAADTFGLSSLPAAKKARVEPTPSEPTSSVVVHSAAPDVLSEVSSRARVYSPVEIDSTSIIYRTHLSRPLWSRVLRTPG